MKKRLLLVLTALTLCVCLCGCVAVPALWLLDQTLQTENTEVPPSTEFLPTAHPEDPTQPELDDCFRKMPYARPDLDAYQELVENSCAIARESEDIDQVGDAIWAVYDSYDEFYTMLSLANIHYCADLTQSYWREENDFCNAHTSEVEAGLESLYQALAESPIRDILEDEDHFGAGYFDSYDGEGTWDETLVELMNQESELINQYYNLCSETADLTTYSLAWKIRFAEPAEELYLQLIALRQQIAQYMGYDSYTQFAYDAYFYRDYTPQQAQAYFDQIQEALVGLYYQVNEAGLWMPDSKYYSEEDTFAYVRSTAQAMGGKVAECFRELDELQLYDIGIRKNKYDSSFEIYLTSYGVPYIFTCPQGNVYDPLSFAHEFGHFCNDYVCSGSYAGTDVSEIFSQGMEYLSLCYGEGDEAVESMKLIDCLNVYVEQAAYASFEQQVYDLKGDDLTVENIEALYEEVCRDFGFDSWGFDKLDFVTMPHYFTDPMYIVSYVVSNDAAFQLYQMELAEAGSGLARYTDNLDSEESYFLTFLETAGLESPFDSGRIESVRDVLTAQMEDLGISASAA